MDSWRATRRENGGEGGIRTLGTITRTTVFETAPFDHSGTSPHMSWAWSWPFSGLPVRQSAAISE